MRIAVIASASGSGKTTLGRELARRLEVEFVELDALVHGPGWSETPDDVLRAQVEPILARHGWVRRTYRRVRDREELWNGNRETLRNTVFARDALFLHAFRVFVHRRRDYPREHAPYPVARLRTAAEVEAFLSRYRELQ